MRDRQQKSKSNKKIDLRKVLNASRVNFEADLKRPKSSMSHKRSSSPLVVQQTKSNSAPVSPVTSLNPKSKQKGNNKTQTSRKRRITTPNNANKAKDVEDKKENEPSGASAKEKKRRLMDEVMRLHQDEGVMNLLHALPTSRRKTHKQGKFIILPWWISLSFPPWNPHLIFFPLR